MVSCTEQVEHYLHLNSKLSGASKFGQGSAMSVSDLIAPDPWPHHGFVGMVQNVAIHGKPQGKKPPSHEEHFNLVLKNGELRRVLFPKEPLKVTV